jgi:hypothetical protein
MYTTEYVRDNLKKDWHYVPSGPYRAGLLTYRESTTVVFRHKKKYYCFIEDFVGVVPNSLGKEVVYEVGIEKDLGAIYTLPQKEKYYRLKILFNKFTDINDAVEEECTQ